MKHGIKCTPTILNRLTITYSEPSTPFMHKAKSSFNKYDILAFTPTTESALKQVSKLKKNLIKNVILIFINFNFMFLDSQDYFYEYIISRFSLLNQFMLSHSSL